MPGGRRPGGTGTASRRLSPAAAVKVAVGLLFVSHAAIAMAGSQKEHNLSLAISARDVIGQAKGILMERHKVTGDQAFRCWPRSASGPTPGLPRWPVIWSRPAN